MRDKYLAGNNGYGHSKQELFELILEKYGTERAEYDRLINDNQALESLLQEGEKKATEVASKVLNRVRAKLGFI